MTLNANPNFLPTGANNKSNDFQKKDTHVRLAKSSVTKSLLSGVAPPPPSGLTAVPFVAPTTETHSGTLTIETTTSPSNMTFAPRAAWFKAVPSGFTFDPINLPNPSYPDIPSWGSPSINLADGVVQDIEAQVDNDIAVTLVFEGVTVTANPSGTLMRMGGTGNGAALVFDPNSNELIGHVGRGDLATLDPTNHVQVAVPVADFINSTVDIVFSVRPNPGRLAVHVYDSTTEEFIAGAAASTEGGAPMGNENSGFWVGNRTTSIGYDHGPSSTPADVYSGDYDGTIPNGADFYNGRLIDSIDNNIDEIAPVNYSREFHQIHYEWDFGDPGSTYTKTVNNLPEHKDANKQYGQIAAHVFKNAGEYTVTCTARQIVSVNPLTIREAVATTTITVTAQSFDSAQILLYSDDPNEDWAGAPASAERLRVNAAGDGYEGRQPNQAWPAMRTAGYDTVVVLLKRGSTFFERPYHNSFYAQGTSSPPNLFYGTWGDEADPAPVVKEWRELGNNNYMTRNVCWVIDGIDIVGDFDPVTGANASNDGLYTAAGDGAYRLFNDMRIANVDIAVNTQFNDGPNATIIFNDIVGENLSTYFIFGPQLNNTHLAILGARDIDRMDVQPGDTINDPNTQGPIRIEDIDELVVDGCDFFTRYGWSDGNQWPDGTAAAAPQPALRLLDNSDNTNPMVVVSRCASEGGGTFVRIGSNTNANTPLGNYLLDSNVHISTAYRGGKMCSSATGAVTMRNSIHVQPNVDISLVRQYTESDEYSATPSGTTSQEDITREPVAYYNNTVLCLQDQGSAIELLDRPVPFVYEYIDNNVLYAPNITGQDGHQTVEPSESYYDITPRYTGRLERADYDTQQPNNGLKTEYATPSPVQILQSGAEAPFVGAITDGDARAVSVWDITGRQRTATPSAGAIEPPYT